MAVLRRLLRKKQLAPLLDQGQRMLGPGWRLVIRPCDEAPSGPCCSAPLHLGGEQVGALDLLPPSAKQLETDPRDLAGMAAFMAACLENTLGDEAVKRRLAGEVLDKYREVSLLHRATLGLNGSLRQRDVAQALLDECRQGKLPAAGGMVFLSLSGADAFTPACSFGEQAIADMAAIARSTLFWDVARTQKGEIVNDLSGDARWRNEARCNALLLCPLVSSNRCVGMLVLAGDSPMRFEASHLQYVGTLATVAGIAIGNALHFESVQTLINSLMQALATAIDARDPFTAGHSQRVARLGVALAKWVHQDEQAFADVAFSAHDLEELLFAGLLHDVGKIGIREEVLTKSSRLCAGVMDVIGQRLALEGLVTGAAPTDDFDRLSRINAADVVTREDAAFVVGLGTRSVRVGGTCLPLLTENEIACLLIPRGNLTPEERREIERHPAESHRILRHIPFPENMSRLLDIISQHHERLDGSGYPNGLKADDILLQSRIIAIVDIYDAITMARHYKPALPREKALDILWQEARAGRIDTRVVALLDAHIAAIEADSQRLGDHLDLAEFLETFTA